MDNENLLNSIYQNIAMVLETIPEIRKITTDCDFKALIISHHHRADNRTSIDVSAISADAGERFVSIYDHFQW